MLAPFISDLDFQDRPHIYSKDCVTALNSLENLIADSVLRFSTNLKSDPSFLLAERAWRGTRLTRFYRSSGSHSLWPGPEGVLSERPAKASFSPNRSAQSLTALHRGLRPAPNYQSPAQEVGEASSDSFGSSATFSQLATLLLSRNRRRERSLLALSTLKADDFPSKPLQDFRPLRSDTLDLEEVFRASLEPSRSSPAAHRPSKVAISR